jgi:hypothetical protein
LVVGSHAGTILIKPRSIRVAAPMRQSDAAAVVKPGATPICCTVLALTRSNRSPNDSLGHLRRPLPHCDTNSRIPEALTTVNGASRFGASMPPELRPRVRRSDPAQIFPVFP